MLLDAYHHPGADPMISWLKSLLPKKCPHDAVRESMACDAWCLQCGKNLGFIQNWRDAKKGNKQASEISNDPGDSRSWK